MTEAATQTNDDAGEYTDEQLQEAFPNQDVTHTRAMIDKMRGKGTPISPNADGGGGSDGDGKDGAPADSGTGDGTVEYPDYMPEKFRQGTVEEAHRKMAESYSVLERARGAKPKSDGDTGDNPDGDGDGAADAGDTASPLNLQDVEAEWISSNGKLSDGTYEAAEAAGMPREVLDAYIAGQQAMADQLVSKVHTMAGGEEQYSTMLQWATKNWTAEEVAEYDRVIATGNVGSIGLAVRALKADFTTANGKAPSLVQGDSDGKGEAAGFQSKAEMVAAMRDPRYKKDPAYRAEVARKIHTGNVWGNR